MGTWQDPELGRPIAAPLERCAELLGVDLTTIRRLATKVTPCYRADGTPVWRLILLERQLRPEAFRRRRGGYIDMAGRARLGRCAVEGGRAAPAGRDAGWAGSRRLAAGRAGHDLRRGGVRRRPSRGPPGLAGLRRRGGAGSDL